jgi:hypothetical protein
MCHYVRLFIQSAGEKHVFMSTVSFVLFFYFLPAGMGQRAVTCGVTSVLENFVIMEQWNSSSLFKMFTNKIGNVRVKLT